jgi:hypothetical protein
MGDGYYYYADYCECNAEEVEEEWDMYTETPYRCEDPFWCALTPPGSDPFVWSSLEDELSEWRVGYFDNDGEAYAPCVEWWEMLENANTYKLYDGMTDGAYYYIGFYSEQIDVSGQDVTYLCYEGRALECVADDDDDEYGTMCIDQVEYGFSPKWEAGESDIMAADQYGDGWEVIGYGTVYNDYYSVESAVDCSRACFNDYGAYMSAFDTTVSDFSGDTSCYCLNAPYETRQSGATDESAPFDYWVVTEIDDNDDGSVF